MDIKELHRRLNRADVTKDAKCPDIRIAPGLPTEFFNRCADNLFGPLNQSFTTELLEIKEHVNTYAKMRHSKLFPKSRVPLSKLRHPMDKYVAYLPDQVQYAIQDSGLAPKQFKEDITYVITPASFIDAAGRSFESRTIYSGFGHTIPKEDFVTLGFQHVNSFTANLLEIFEGSQQCETTLTLSFLPRPLNTRFTEDMAPYIGDVMPFKGNNEKNAWFNSVKRQTNDTQNIGQAFIVAKELGDTLQAYYGKLLSGGGSNKVCLFTSDSVLTTRCRIMELPVVVLDHEKSKNDVYECFYYPAPGIVDAEIVRLFENIVISHNNDVKRVVEYVLLSGRCIVQNTRRLVFNNAHKTILKQIVSHIESINGQCRKFKNSIDTKYMTIEEYRNEIYTHLLPHFFQQIGPHYHANSSIRAGQVTFEEHLLRPRVGGGDTIDNLSESEFETIEYTKYGDDVMYELSFEDQIKRRIYMILSDDPKSKHVLVPETERVFDYVFRMFSYTGVSTLNFQILRKIIGEYVCRNDSHEIFAELYQSWIDKELLENEDQDEDKPVKTQLQKFTRTHRKSLPTRSTTRRRRREN